MNILIATSNDSAGKNVSSYFLANYEFVKSDRFIEDSPILFHRSKSVNFGLLNLNSLIDENSLSRKDEINKLSLDLLIMVAWHSGSELNSIVLRNAGNCNGYGKGCPGVFKRIANSLIEKTYETDIGVWFESTHGPSIHYDCPFLVLEIGGQESDWQNHKLGQLLVEAILTIQESDFTTQEYCVAFGKSWCSKTVLKSCREKGIVHYFAGHSLNEFLETENQLKYIIDSVVYGTQLEILFHKKLPSEIIDKMTHFCIDGNEINTTYFK